MANTVAAALLALWNDVTPAHEDEYNDWHACEHVPERLTMPGFVWAQRWRAVEAEGPGPRYLTLYGLAGLDALESPEYKRLLAGPTPWSQRMRPHLLHLSRWACELRAGRDAVVQSPGPGRGSVTDTFSLSGFTAAYEAISRECPAGRR